MWWKNRFNGFTSGMLMDPNKNDGGGGGSGGTGGNGGNAGAANGGNGGGDGNKPDPRDAKIAELEAALKKASGGGGGGNSNDADLAARTERERQTRANAQAENRRLESAVAFTIGSNEFLKSNQDLLPESVKELFATADKESFDSATQKAAEIKSGIIQEFFRIQANMDLLTAAQKTRLADFLKLTKDGKRDLALDTYENILEPTLERLRAVKKAEQVAKARDGYGDGTDDAYKKRLIAHSQKHYGLGEKK